MRGRVNAGLGSCAAIGLIAATGAYAETVTHTYDVLGRLRTSSVSGGPNSGTNTAICYDAANNRQKYVTAIGGAASSTPTPTPTPTPTNQPPVAVADSAMAQMCGWGEEIAVLANDSDPEGNTPLAIVSVSAANMGTPALLGSAGNGTAIFYQPNGYSAGTDSFTYQVRDSLGAVSTGTVTVNVMNVGC